MAPSAASIIQSFARFDESSDQKQLFSMAMKGATNFIPGFSDAYSADKVSSTTHFDYAGGEVLKNTATPKGKEMAPSAASIIQSFARFDESSDQKQLFSMAMKGATNFIPGFSDAYSADKVSST